MTKDWRWCWKCGNRQHFQLVGEKWQCKRCKEFEKEKEKKVEKGE